MAHIRLGRWLADHIDGDSSAWRLSSSPAIVDLTFRVRDGMHDWVLRHPPLSHVLATRTVWPREVRRAADPLS